MRRTRLSTTLVAAAAVTFGLASPVAMADDAPETPISSDSSTDNPTESDKAGDTSDPEGSDGKGGAEGDETNDDEEPDTIFGSSVEQTEKFEEVMSWVSVVGALLAGIVQATVMLAQINPAILNPLKDLLKQAGVKF